MESRAEDGHAGRYATGYHAPVLWHTVVRDLITDRSGIYVDGTMGGGGHTAALLDALADDALVIGIDRDQEAHSVVQERLGSEIDRGRLRLAVATFAHWPVVLDSFGIERVDGLLLDIGVSSHQLDEPGRGFSYAAAGPLDMRMDPEGGLTAADIINEWDEGAIRRILYDFGEESRARSIVGAIIRSRPIDSTAELADVIRSAVPTRDEVKSLSRVFQALRIAVNDELGQLERALEAADWRIKIGGRVAVISYHSLEDRRVKRFFRSGNFEGEVARDVYGNRLVGWRDLYRKPVVADEDEVARNPRARSARMRVAERVKEVSTMQ